MKSRLKCENCEGLIEMDQSRRVSGTPYFQSVIPVASSEPSNRARETDTDSEKERETERTASLTSDLEGNQLSSAAQQAMAQNQSTNTHMHARTKTQKRSSKNGNLRYLCLPSFVLRRLQHATHTSKATQHITWWSASASVASVVSETGHFHFQLLHNRHLCLLNVSILCCVFRSSTSSSSSSSSLGL